VFDRPYAAARVDGDGARVRIDQPDQRHLRIDVLMVPLVSQSFVPIVPNRWAFKGAITSDRPLPRTTSDELSAAIVNNPDLMEDIYPVATSGGTTGIDAFLCLLSVRSLIAVH